MTKLSFPGGAGGNWIKKVLFDHPFDYNTENGHFHAGTDILYPSIKLSHDTKQFDILLNGDCCLNISLNLAVKFHMIQARNYVDASWGEAFANMLDCVNSTIEKYSEFSVINPDLNYATLFVDSEVFFKQVQKIQKKLNLKTIDYENFLQKRKRYIDSCVSTTNIINNWDNEFWVIYVLGDLQQQGICPETFSVFDRKNYNKTRQWAQENFHRCKYPTSYVMLDTPIKINTIDDLTNYS